MYYYKSHTVSGIAVRLELYQYEGIAYKCMLQVPYDDGKVHTYIILAL